MVNTTTKRLLIQRECGKLIFDFIRKENNMTLEERIAELKREIAKINDEEYRFDRTSDKPRVCELFNEIYLLKKELNKK